MKKVRKIAWDFSQRYSITFFESKTFLKPIDRKITVSEGEATELTFLIQLKEKFPNFSTYFYVEHDVCVQSQEVIYVHMSTTVSKTTEKESKRTKVNECERER